ncbi:MAG: hypothetical protein ASARMPRED_007722 [Alectoria sarmentosa]|nr:MAG: hypothetical protein ASARMPRED_007722 [Alectoria sarmentosa]
MTQGFLDQLPKARSGELPNGAECMICQEEYGTGISDNGVIEHAVFLPCLHHVGSECIATWLSPDDGPGNSCPMCRTVFFPPQSGDHDDEDEDSSDGFSDEDDEDGSEDGNDDHDDGAAGDESNDTEDRIDGREPTPMTLLGAFQRLASSSVTTPPRQEIEGQDGQEWFERWPLLTRQQIDDSQKRARQALSTPPASGFLQRSPRTYAPPPDLELRAAELAAAYRTTAFRETLLYMNLQEAGARIPPLEFPHRVLSAQHEEILLWELGQRGAFIPAEGRPAQMAMTNRQSWYVHRAKGEVYTYEDPAASGRGYWTTDLSIE